MTPEQEAQLKEWAKVAGAPVFWQEAVKHLDELWAEIDRLREALNLAQETLQRMIINRPQSEYAPTNLDLVAVIEYIKALLRKSNRGKASQ